MNMSDMIKLLYIKKTILSVESIMRTFPLVAYSYEVFDKISCF